MNAVFADTFYWVALTHKHDARHDEARTMLVSLDAPSIVTTDAVVTEYLNFLAEWDEPFRRKAEGDVSGHARLILGDCCGSVRGIAS